MRFFRVSDEVCINIDMITLINLKYCRVRLSDGIDYYIGREKFMELLDVLILDYEKKNET